jgi:beta-1,4-N-acetylglucosaminyltransferase
MIFVTVGTTAFEGLIEAADRLPKDLGVVIQKADGQYEPKNHPFFDYTDKFDEYVRKADLVVTHGGAGTLFDLMDKGKKIIGVANEERSDHHQSDLLQELSDSGYILWCRDLTDLARTVTEGLGFTPQNYVKPESNIAKDIVSRFACLER